MTESRDHVISKPIGRAVWSLAWPIVVSNELSMLTTAVMLFWLGRLVGDTGVAVESLFRPFELCIAWFFASTAVGASVLVSRSVGADDGRGMTIATATLTLTLALWAAVAVPMVAGSSWLSSVLAGDVPVQRSLLAFLLGWLLVALPGTSIAEVLLEVANATGDTRFNLVRVLIDLVFMAALTPLAMSAGLGIAGAPVTQGAAALGLAVLLWAALWRRRTEFRLGDPKPVTWKIRSALWKEILGVGLPVQLGRVAMFVAQMVLVQRVAQQDEAAVAGYGIAGVLLLFGVMATLGLAQGGGILVGQSLGAKLPDRARRGTRATLVLGWLVMAGYAIATLFDRPIIEMFTSDAAVIDHAVRALSILRWAGFAVATWQILLAAFAAHRATLRASALIIASEACGIAIAFLWRGSYLDAACFAILGANALKALALLALYARGGLKA